MGEGFSVFGLSVCASAAFFACRIDVGFAGALGAFFATGGKICGEAGSLFGVLAAAGGVVLRAEILCSGLLCVSINVTGKTSSFGASGSWRAGAGALGACPEREISVWAMTWRVSRKR